MQAKMSFLSRQWRHATVNGIESGDRERSGVDPKDEPCNKGEEQR